MPYPGSRFVLPDRSSLRTHLAEQVNPYAEPWLNIGDAIGFIMSRRDIGPENAQTKLREACLSGKVRSRHLVIFIDKNDEKRIGFHWLPEEAWTWWNTVDVASGALHTLDLGRVDQVEVSEFDLSTWLARPRRGPVVGKIARYADLDRALFDEMERIMQEGSKSPAEAARDLACQGRVKGGGTPDSRARRLANLYRKERPHRTR
jgi:hypothetical protein